MACYFWMNTVIFEWIFLLITTYRYKNGPSTQEGPFLHCRHSRNTIKKVGFYPPKAGVGFLRICHHHSAHLTKNRLMIEIFERLFKLHKKGHPLTGDLFIWFKVSFNISINKNNWCLVNAGNKTNNSTVLLTTFLGIVASHRSGLAIPEHWNPA